jgi:hypothetical protein
MTISRSLLDQNITKIVNAIKLLIYKEDARLLEMVDFYDDSVFLEPLLFVYFNTKEENNFSCEMLQQIIQGYFTEKKSIKIDTPTFDQEITYLPRLGYFYYEGKIPFEKIELINGTNIEIIKYPSRIFKGIYKDSSNNSIDENKILINDLLYKKNITVLTNAFNFIKKCSSDHFEIIEASCKKCIIFKANPELTNSFATISAHGIAFFNVYQDDYDEVFFVDDIAHQTGHIILTTLCFERKSIFKIDEKINIGQILNNNDYRDVYTLLHALFTYYTTFMCLDNCIEGNVFNKNQLIESKARIGFYTKKSEIDLLNFNKVCEFFNGIQNVLTDDGIDIFKKIIYEHVRINNKNGRPLF